MRKIKYSYRDRTQLDSTTLNIRKKCAFSSGTTGRALWSFSIPCFHSGCIQSPELAISDGSPDFGETSQASHVFLMSAAVANCSFISYRLDQYDAI